MGRQHMRIEDLKTALCARFAEFDVFSLSDLRREHA
jgi:hypothetical protein